MQLLERIAQHATDDPHRPAVVEISSQRTLTYGELQLQLSELAGELRSRVRPGGIVMLRCSNIARFHAAFLGSLAAKMQVFPVPAGATTAELDALVRKASVAAVVDESAITSLDTQDDATSEGPALLLQSSGTTGLPKIVHRDAASLDAVAAQMVEATRIIASDRLLSCVPLAHSYGLEHGLLAPLWAGVTIHLANGFDLDQVRSTVANARITVFPSVPSVYEMLANLHEPERRFSSLRLAYSAGGALPDSIFERLRDRCGITVGQLYGATEIGSVTFAHPDDPRFNAASVGLPMRGVELQIDADGQLFVRAASMMSGYMREDSTITPDGFFPTGDLARLDNHGNLFITGRLKLLIDVGGLKVNPLEVEQALAEHPGVAACVVVPMRLSETVSRLKAILTPLDPANPPTLESLRTFAKEQLSMHKVPRVFEVRDSLPRSTTGKILRHLLIETP